MKKVEFAKKITVVAIVFWIASIIAMMTIEVIFNKDVSHLMSYIFPVTMLAYGGYLGKAGYENKYKIQSNKEYSEESGG